MSYQKENIQYDFTYELQKMQTRWKSDQALPRGEARRKTGIFRAAQRNSGVEDVLNWSVGFTGATICQNLHNYTLQISVPYINFISVSLPIWGGVGGGKGGRKTGKEEFAFFKKDQHPGFFTSLVGKLNDSTCLLNLKWQLESKKQGISKIVKSLHEMFAIICQTWFFQHI